MHYSWFSKTCLGILVFFSASSAYADVFSHYYNNHIFSSEKSMSQETFQFEGRHYCAEVWGSPLTPYEVKLSSFLGIRAIDYLTIRRLEEDFPFIVMCNNRLRFKSSFDCTPPRLITVESCLVKEDGEKEFLLRMVSMALTACKKEVDYVHFENEPLVESSGVPEQLETRFVDILKHGDPWSVNMGCSPLNYTRTKNEGGISFIITYSYSDKEGKETYSNAGYWAARYSHVGGMQEGLGSFQGIDTTRFQEFLQGCQEKYNTKGEKSYNLATLYKQIIAFEDAEDIKNFKELFLSYNNPLIAKIAYHITQDGLDPNNAFHRLLAYKIIEDANFLISQNQKNMNSLKDEEKLVELIAKIDISQAFKTYVNKLYESLEEHSKFPLERSLVSCPDKEKVKELLANRKFTLLKGINSQEFASMVKSALECVKEKEFQKAHIKTIQALHDLLGDDLSWSTYFFGKQKSPGEDYLTWFFCKNYIDHFGDFFVAPY